MSRMSGDQRRNEIYRYVRDRILSGSPPTVREVQEACGFRAVESARSHLDRLVEEGRLAKRPGKARGFALPGPAADHDGDGRPDLIPLIGRVAAGELTSAIESPEGYVAVQSRFAANELFALRVHGESMRDAAILDGDLVIVRRQASADSGDVVVALVEDDATVKTLFRGTDRLELGPGNPDFTPIVPPPDELVILGKVVEVRRYLDDEVILP